MIGEMDAPDRNGPSLAAPPLADVVRMERALGWRPMRFRRAAENRGASDTAHWIVANDANSGFVKIGATDLTAGWARAEYRTYGSLDARFLPRVLGFDDDGVRPVLALEDLSEAVWPPPWTDEGVAGVLATLDSISHTVPPEHLRGREIDWGTGWRDVEQNPAPFLDLGLCSPEWLETNLPVLISASEGAPFAGDSLVHLDVRSDNLCFRDGRAVLVDWNHAGVANADIDIAAWLPSLHAEGGPPPETVLPSAPGFAAWIAGYFCSHAGGALLPGAPHVRPLQLRQARTALPWAARALDLAPPGRHTRPRSE